MTHYDAIVLGTGGVGSAALFHLARRGVRALGLDRFGPGHDRGSSHGATRIIRQAYSEHSDYVPLLLRAYELWADLAERQRRTLYHETGLLQVGPPQGEPRCRSGFWPRIARACTPPIRSGGALPLCRNSLQTRPLHRLVSRNAQTGVTLPIFPVIL